MTVRILGLGTARPAHSIPQDEAARFAIGCAASDTGANGRPAKLLPDIYRRTSVQQRGSVLLETSDDRRITAESLGWFYPPPPGGDTPSTAARMEQFQRLAPPLALASCRAALDAAGLAPADITHLVTVTCTGFASPGVEHALIEQLGLPRTTQRAQVGFMGCHGALNGLNVAAAFAAAHPAAKVLLCSVELCSLHFQYGFDSNRIVGNALFADGSAAAVLSAGDGDWRVSGSATCLLTGTADEMTWHVGDHGFEMTLSPKVPAAIAAQLRPWIDEFLAAHQLTVPDIRGWAIHAGGPRIVSAVAERLGLSDEATEPSSAILRDCGNMSSATILFILDRLRTSGAQLPCVMLAFGPGLTAEAVLLR